MPRTRGRPRQGTKTKGPKAPKSKREQQPFRFLDLPAEIRQMIYAEALCTFEPNLAFGVNGRLRGIIHDMPDGWPEAPNLLIQNINTSLLRTCRFVHDEAFDFMIKANRYVRVSAYDVNLECPLLESHIPFLSWKRNRVGQFPGHIMHVTLENLGRGRRNGPRLRFRSKSHSHAEPPQVLLHISVLPAFCTALGWATFLQERLHISIKIGDLSESRGFAKLRWESFCSPAIVESLLEPFHHYAWGFESADIWAPHQIDLISRLVQTLTASNPWSFDEECIGAAKKEIKFIDSLMAKGKFIDASERCSEAENMISHYEEGLLGYPFKVSKFSLFLAELTLRDAQCYEHELHSPVNVFLDRYDDGEMYNWIHGCCTRTIRHCERSGGSQRAQDLTIEARNLMKKVLPSFFLEDDLIDESDDGPPYMW